MAAHITENICFSSAIADEIVGTIIWAEVALDSGDEPVVIWESQHYYVKESARNSRAGSDLLRASKDAMPDNAVLLLHVLSYEDVIDRTIDAEVLRRIRLLYQRQGFKHLADTWVRGKTGVWERAGASFAYAKPIARMSAFELLNSDQAQLALCLDADNPPHYQGELFCPT